MLLLENFTEENESPNFDKAMNRSRDKYQNASSPMKFLNETICNFTRNSVHQLSRIEKEVFSNNKVMVIIIYSRRKIQFLFNKKDADLHIRWNENNTRRDKNSEFVKYLNYHFNDKFLMVCFIPSLEKWRHITLRVKATFQI